MRCSICGLSTTAKIIIEEPRYFVSKQNVCLRCFNLWTLSEYDALDDLAREKIR